MCVEQSHDPSKGVKNKLLVAFFVRLFDFDLVIAPHLHSHLMNMEEVEVSIHKDYKQNSGVCISPQLPHHKYHRTSRNTFRGPRSGKHSYCSVGAKRKKGAQPLHAKLHDLYLTKNFTVALKHSTNV